MTAINLRNVPDELARQAKATAATEGVTLRAFVMGALEQRLKRGEQVAAAEKRQGVKAEPVASEKPQPMKATPPPVSEPTKATRFKMVDGEMVFEGDR